MCPERGASVGVDSLIIFCEPSDQHIVCAEWGDEAEPPGCSGVWGGAHWLVELTGGRTGSSAFPVRQHSEDELVSQEVSF